MHYSRSGTFRLVVAYGEGVAYKNRTTGRLFQKQFIMRNFKVTTCVAPHLGLWVA